MEAKQLLNMGLGLEAPWSVVEQELDTDKDPSELRLRVSAERGVDYPCPKCGKPCKAHDFEEQQWRHLNFFQHHCLIKARVPRVRCEEHGVLRARVPWARPGSGFTLLFEQAVLLLAREMPVSKVAAHVGVTDKRLWRVLKHYVSKAMGGLDLSQLKAFAVDETARKRGHKYVSIFIDLDREERPVVFATRGKDAEAVKLFKEWLEKKGGKADNVAQVVCDMSGAFISGSREHFPEAAITVDWFHVVQLFTKAVDEVRRKEAADWEMPEGARWTLLKGIETRRTESQEAALIELEECGYHVAEAFRIKEMLRWIRRAATSQAARWRTTHFLTAARRIVDDLEYLEPMKRCLRTFEEHLEMILNSWPGRLSNGRLEGLNGLFQAARARARGYRNSDNFITMIYLLAAPLGDLAVKT